MRGSLSRHDELIHVLTHDIIWLAVRRTRVLLQFFTSVNNEVPAVGSSSDSSCILDQDRFTSHIRALHVMDLINKLRLVAIRKNVQTRHRLVEIQAVIWQLLDPETLDVVLNIDIRQESADSEREEKFLTLEAIEWEFAI